MRRLVDGGLLPSVSLRAARTAGAVLEDFHFQSLATDDLAFWDEVFAWLAKYADHEPDWTDACIAALCGRDKRLKVWTYDREFRTTWRRPDGRPIPLAIK